MDYTMYHVGSLIVSTSYLPPDLSNELVGIFNCLSAPLNNLLCLSYVLCILYFLFLPLAVRGFDMLQQMLFKLCNPLVETPEMFFDLHHSALQ